MKSKSKTRLCPQCGKEFVSEDQSLLPFCSKRCKMIDLGQWLTEKYVVGDKKPKTR